jgi:tetratricopeptide (TPR) repeat protein
VTLPPARNRLECHMARRSPLAGVIILLLMLLAPAGLADEARQEAPTDPAQKVLIAAGGLYERGLFEDAVAEYQQFLSRFKGHKEVPAAHYGMGLCYYQLGEHDKCLQQLDAALKHRDFKSRADALAVAGHAAVNAGKHREAIAYLSELIDRHRESDHREMARLNRAQARYMLGEYPAGQPDRLPRAAGWVAEALPAAGSVRLELRKMILRVLARAANSAG